MRKTFAPVIILALMAAFNPATVWSADAVTDAGQVALQSASLAGLQQAAAEVGNYDLKNIKVDLKAHQILITVIDSAFNSTSASDREMDASKIVVALANAIKDKPEFSQVAVMHVEYVGLHDQVEKHVQGFDFYKDNAGVFSLHKT
jgi:hypothetical protein